mmetsp:Transcript_12039/g.24599  ORF Transcript_12039/g.24599 Transcript_12039/m.24599 type:complete len:216 (+) Transcript_12039:435-1082(+)
MLLHHQVFLPLPPPILSRPPWLQPVIEAASLRALALELQRQRQRQRQPQIPPPTRPPLKHFLHPQHLPQLLRMVAPPMLRQKLPLPPQPLKPLPLLIPQLRRPHKRPPSLTPRLPFRPPLPRKSMGRRRKSASCSFVSNPSSSRPLRTWRRPHRRRTGMRRPQRKLSPRQRLGSGRRWVLARFALWYQFRLWLPPPCALYRGGRRPLEVRAQRSF